MKTLMDAKTIHRLAFREIAAKLKDIVALNPTKRRLRNGAEFLILRNLTIRFGPLSFQRTQCV